MSRTRLIKPALFENEILGQMAGDTVLCFAGLWCLADREGRLEDRPLRIKAKLFPYREVIVEEALKQLSEGGFITRYQIEKDAFIQIVNFDKHQNPHRAEQASIIPPLENLPTKDGTSTDQGQTKESRCRALTLNLMPSSDTLTLNPSSPPGESGVGDTIVEVKASKPRKGKSSTDEDPDFEKFWEAYPRKVAKPKAFAAWEKAKLPEIADILASISAQSSSDQWSKEAGKYIPHPTTWITGERWSDVTASIRKSVHADF